MRDFLTSLSALLFGFVILGITQLPGQILLDSVLAATTAYEVLPTVCSYDTKTHVYTNCVYPYGQIAAVVVPKIQRVAAKIQQNTETPAQGKEIIGRLLEKLQEMKSQPGMKKTKKFVIEVIYQEFAVARNA